MARSRRELLLGVHRHRLRHEDLEDCYGQATLELITRVRRGGTFIDARHLAHVLEQRFVSRIRDRRRALSGRSPMQAALEQAVALGHDGDGVAIIDARAEVERLVFLRHDLERLRACVGRLTSDQQLVLGCQLGGVEREEVCRCLGWSAEKYRKVAQRGRARLRSLMADESVDVPVAR